MVESLSPMDWASRQFGDANLGDKRRTDRLVKMGTALVQRSGASLPKQMEGPASLKAAYRLLDSDGVTHESVSEPHWISTRDKVRTPGLGKVLFVQDGTELDYSGHRNAEGLGFSGNSKNYGIQVQTTLCVLPGKDDLETEVVGLALQSPWVRDHEPRRKTESNFERTRSRLFGGRFELEEINGNDA